MQQALAPRRFLEIARVNRGSLGAIALSARGGAVPYNGESLFTPRSGQVASRGHLPDTPARGPIPRRGPD